LLHCYVITRRLEIAVRRLVYAIGPATLAPIGLPASIVELALMPPQQPV